MVMYSAAVLALDNPGILKFYEKLEKPDNYEFAHFKIQAEAKDWLLKKRISTSPSKVPLNLRLA